MDNDRPAHRRRDLKGDARRARILELLDEERGDLTVEEIAERFGVSFATVRRDLARLRDEHGVARTYGGVTAIRPAEVSTRERSTTFRRAKQAIGRAAAGFVADGDTVVLDAGTTTTALAHELGDHRGITVVTNGIGVMTALLDADDVEVMVLGGRLRRINETITGPVAEDMLRHLVAATAFLGADTIDPVRGIASRTFEQSRLKTLMMHSAARVVVLADSSKLDGGAFTYWSPLDRPWELVTDAGASAAQVEAARAAGAVQVHLAHDDGVTTAWPDVDDTRQEIS